MVTGFAVPSRVICGINIISPAGAWTARPVTVFQPRVVQRPNLAHIR